MFAGLVAYPAAATGRYVSIVAWNGAVGWCLLLVGLSIRRPAFIAWGVAAFGAEYAVFLRLRGGSVDSRAPFVAAALIVVAELAFRAVRSSRVRSERRASARSLVSLALAAVSAALAGGVLLVAAGSIRSGIFLEAVGAACAVATLAIVVRIAARSRESTST